MLAKVSGRDWGAPMHNSGRVQIRHACRSQTSISVDFICTELPDSRQ